MRFGRKLMGTLLVLLLAVTVTQATTSMTTTQAIADIKYTTAPFESTVDAVKSTMTHHPSTPVHLNLGNTWRNWRDNYGWVGGIVQGAWHRNPVEAVVRGIITPSRCYSY